MKQLIRVHIAGVLLSSLFVTLVHATPPTPPIVDVNVVNTVDVNDASTKILFEDFIQVTDPITANNPIIGPLDVSAYKTVRVVVTESSCGPCPASYTAEIETGGDLTIVAFDHLNWIIGENATKTYDTLAPKLRIRLSSNIEAASSVYVLVVGRSN